MAISDRVDIRSLLVGKTSHLRFVKRFSAFPIIRSENVAEHSFYVVFISMVLADALQLNDARKLTVMRKATLHDIEECVSGDFVRPFKYSSPQLRDALEVAGEEAAKQCFNSFLTSEGASSSGYTSEWVNSKDSSVSGQIVKLADFLAVVSYMWYERQSGNRLMAEHGQSLLAYYDLIRDSRDAYLYDDVLSTAHQLIREVCE